MATRAMIAILNNDNTVTASYCHYDGYTSGVGVTLSKNYSDATRARAVAECGYLSTLFPNFDLSLDEAVHKNEQPVPYESVEQYLKNGADWAGAEYLYIWDGAAWFVSEVYGADRRFTDVETMMAVA